MGDRLNRFEQKGEIPSLADLHAANWLGARAAATQNAAQNNQIITQLGRLLADAAFAYVNQKTTQTRREQLERVVLAAEQALRTAAGSRLPAGQAGNVSAAILNTGPDQGKRITQEVAKWIGAPGAPGALNRAPFNLPPGLNIQRAMPATSTATAAAAG
jgi:hypothetical protein